MFWMTVIGSESLSNNLQSLAAKWSGVRHFIPQNILHFTVLFFLVTQKSAIILWKNSKEESKPKTQITLAKNVDFCHERESLEKHLWSVHALASNCMKWSENDKVNTPFLYSIKKT